MREKPSVRFFFSFFMFKHPTMDSKLQQKDVLFLPSHKGNNNKKKSRVTTIVGGKIKTEFETDLKIWYKFHHHVYECDICIVNVIIYM